jgi:signal peptidase I
MSYKTITRLLLIIVVLCLVGTVFFYILSNPHVVYGEQNKQVINVTSGSMEPTILAGNSVLVDKQVNPSELSVAYPNSDIIAFHKPGNPTEIIVHRIVGAEERDGTLFFYTKGDGNGANKYPDIPKRSEYDPWNSGQGVDENLVIGKVVDTDYPVMLYTLVFWLMAIVSIVAGIALLVLYVVDRSKKSRKRIRQLEERIEQLESK